MKIRILFIIVLATFPNLINGQGNVSSPGLTRILFVLDCSQSMAGEWGDDRKIDIARKFLGQTIDSLGNHENVEMALRVYGHQSVVPPQDCSDTKLEVRFAPGNGYLIKRKMASLSPRGTTPIANSLAATTNDFPDCTGCRNIIILITDGIEACDGDPCQVSKELQKQGIILKPFIIGIGLDQQFEKSFECLGNLYNASSEERFEEVLDIVISHALIETTLQVSLIDEYGFPSETNVPMTFYNKMSDQIRYNFVHTLNQRGNPDTLRIDPLVDYSIKVHTVPPVFYDSLRLAPGKHNIAAIDVPQGYLNVVQERGFQYRNTEYIVRENGSLSTLCRQKMFEKRKYITGRYDLEISTLPVTRLYNVEIKQSEETIVTLPQPGIITFLVNNEGICELFVERNNDLEWIYSVDTSEKSNSVVLLPGNYRLIYRSLFAKQSYFTIEKRFTIESGKSSSLRVF